MPDSKTDDEGLRRIVAELAATLKEASDALPLDAQMALIYQLEPEREK
jgi:hypothetical protein